jgi:hypothetical protein
MLETLHDRLKWKQTDRGVLIAIPVRRGALTHLYGPLVGIWLAFVAMHYRHLMTEPHLEDTEFTLQMIAAGIYILGFLFAVCWLLWIFTCETVVLINAREMKILLRVMGIEVASRSFTTSEIRGLKFIPPITSWASMGHPDPRTSRTQFRIGKTTHILAIGVSENESLALFAAMQRVYRFPDFSYSHISFARVGI